MPETITLEEIPVPLSLFIFRHYLNHVALPKEPPKEPSKEPTTYIISTTAPTTAPSESAPQSRRKMTTENPVCAADGVADRLTRKNIIKYRNVPRAEGESMQDVSWMDLGNQEMDKTKPQKSTQKNRNKKTKNKSHKSHTEKPFLADSETISLETKFEKIKLQDEISPFLLVDERKEEDDNQEPWRTVEKPRRYL